MADAPGDICQARLGTTLKGKWRLEKLLGVGGMAAVYAGVHKIGRTDAIKILHPEVAASDDLKARFQREAEATNRFSHSGAVEIRDFDVTDDGCPFLVMEMLEGESLGERARRLGDVPAGELLGYVDELLDVLAAAHKEGIVHRDIKLDNLFVTDRGSLKVLDFGIARMRSGPALTMSGMRLGTTAYMPPEQVQGREIDGRADLFAVGATMFRLLAKRRIHEAPTEGELVVKMATEPAPRMAVVAPHVDARVAAIVDRALEFNSVDRYPNALTMQADVRAVRAANAPPYASARANAPATPALVGAYSAFEPSRAISSAAAAEPTRAEPRTASARPPAPRPAERAAGAAFSPIVHDPTRAPVAGPAAFAGTMAAATPTPPVASRAPSTVALVPGVRGNPTPMPFSAAVPSAQQGGAPGSHSAGPVTPMSMAVPGSAAYPYASQGTSSRNPASDPPQSYGAHSVGAMSAPFQSGFPGPASSAVQPSYPPPAVSPVLPVGDPRRTSGMGGPLIAQPRKSNAATLFLVLGALGIVGILGAGGGYFYLTRTGHVSERSSDDDESSSERSKKKDKTTPTATSTASAAAAPAAKPSSSVAAPPDSAKGTSTPAKPAQTPTPGPADRESAPVPAAVPSLQVPVVPSHEPTAVPSLPKLPGGHKEKPGHK